MTELPDLPLVIRTRVVALAADVLPDVAQLPPSLRRVASFAPARRARLGSLAISEALADDGLRDRVAKQVAVRRSEEVIALRAGRLADPIESAALDWLIRPAGWDQRLGPSVEHVAEAAPAPRLDEEARLRDRVAHVEQTLRELRAAHRQQVEDYKAEIATLRRTLGEERQRDRHVGRDLEEAAEAAARARAAAEEARLAAEAQVAAQAVEVRRLQATVDRLQVEAGRESPRAEREEYGIRARLLLDTILDAASGLRRELALPPVTGTPGQRQEASLAAQLPEADPSPSVAPGSAPLLDRYLSMPRARLIVDGYNVSKAAWPTSSLETQRLRLMNALAPIVARSGAETTIVFDAADADTRPPVHPPRGVRVVFSPRGVIADRVIGDLVDAEPPGRVVIVVTDDREVVVRIQRAGARAVASQVLIDLMAR